MLSYFYSIETFLNFERQEGQGGRLDLEREERVKKIFKFDKKKEVTFVSITIT